MSDAATLWLDTNFIKAALQGGDTGSSSISILKYSVEPAVPPGSNFSSHIHRVAVQYTHQDGKIHSSASFIVKSPYTTGVYVALAEKLDFYLKEPIIYGKLLPSMFEKVKQLFGPTSYYSSVKGVLVLQDLSAEGFVVFRNPLDFTHSKEVIKLLAKFHAASVACFHEDPALFKVVGKEIFFTEGPIEKEECIFFKSRLNAVKGILHEIEGCEKVKTLLNRNFDLIWESVKYLVKPKKDSFNVLNHGDMWYGNILFKYNEVGGLVGVKFIDFQLSTFSSPALDLMEFIWTSVNVNVRANHQLELYSIYLQTLNESLKNQGMTERLSAEDLNGMLHSATDWIVKVVCLTLPTILSGPEGVVNLDELPVEDSDSSVMDIASQKACSTNKFTSVLPIVLKQFEDWINNSGIQM